MRTACKKCGLATGAQTSRASFVFGGIGWARTAVFGLEQRKHITFSRRNNICTQECRPGRKSMGRASKQSLLAVVWMDHAKMRSQRMTRQLTVTLPWTTAHCIDWIMWPAWLAFRRWLWSMMWASGEQCHQHTGLKAFAMKVERKNTANLMSGEKGQCKNMSMWIMTMVTCGHGKDVSVGRARTQKYWPKGIPGSFGRKGGRQYEGTQECGLGTRAHTLQASCNE